MLRYTSLNLSFCYRVYIDGVTSCQNATFSFLMDKFLWISILCIIRRSVNINYIHLIE
jgi:hypothetical protein